MMKPIDSDNKKTRPGSIALLWDFMGRNHWTYIMAMGFTACATIAAYMVPLILQVGIDTVVGNRPLSAIPVVERLVLALTGGTLSAGALWRLAATMVGFSVVNGLFTFVAGRGAALASENTAASIRNRLYDHLQRLPYAYHARAETGDLVQRCTSDVDTVRRFLAVQLVEIARAVILVATALPILLFVNTTLTWISLPLIPILVGFSFIFFKWVQAAFTASDEAEGRMSARLQENLDGVRVVRAFGREAYEETMFDARNRHHRTMTRHLVRLLALYWSLSDLLSMTQIAVVLIAGVVLSVTGSLTVGELVLFMMVQGMVLWPVRQMGRILSDLGKSLVSAGRIQAILDEPLEEEAWRIALNRNRTETPKVTVIPARRGRTPRIAGSVRFENVSFSYDGTRPVLDNVTFDVEQGETVAFLGPTGSGKSTLVQLLPRLYDYVEGSITVDGVELNTIDREWIRRHIGFVLQEPFLYGKTIADNIRMARPDLPDVAIFEAARAAAVHDVIENFDGGYETLVGERGVTLSGGQKQRIAIARALLSDAPIMVFDDSLSAVDTETDALIRVAMRRRVKATTFIVSHRINTLKEADKIVVLDEGSVTHIGTHEELIEEDGLYRRIWDIQTGWDADAAGDLGRVAGI